MADKKNSKIRKPGLVRRPGMGNQGNPYADRTRLVDREAERHAAQEAAEREEEFEAREAIRESHYAPVLAEDEGDEFVGLQTDMGDTEIRVSGRRESGPRTSGTGTRSTGSGTKSGTGSESNTTAADKLSKKQRKKKKKTSVLKQQKVTQEEYRFHKKMGRRRRKTALVIFIIIIMIAVTLAAGYATYTFVVDHFDNKVTELDIIIDRATEQKFRVEKGEPTKSLSQRLFDAGLIKNVNIYRFLSKFYGYDGQYNAGTYTLSEGLSYEEIMFILSGTPETVKVTFPEGFTTEQIATRLENNNVCTAEEFLKAVDTVDVSSYDFLKGADLSGRDHRLDGYLFPDTYEFDVMARPEDVIYKMLNRFNQIFKPVYYEHLNDFGLTLDQVVILASIVEKEAKLDGDRAPIAGVFYNRYMNWEEPLDWFQSDATVRYAYRRATGMDLDHNLADELELDDPYNTYVYTGFPPGPICSPGEASLIAALYPSNHDYYYFVARSDGSGGNIYTRTYEEHMKAVTDQANYVEPDDPGYEDDYDEE